MIIQLLQVSIKLKFHRMIHILYLLYLYNILLCAGMKYKYIDLKHPCGQCEEHFKIFYEIEDFKFCPRCTLEHISFNFPNQNLDEIQYYAILTDIIFDHV